MIAFVDLEHVSGHGQPWGEKLLAARTWITYRLEDMAGRHCMLIRYDRVSAELFDRLGIEAMFISGNSAAPEVYEPGSLDALRGLIASRAIPTFGFCGGMQVMATSLGGDLVPLDDGAKEFGYDDVELTGSHSILDGLGPTEIVRHAHSLHVPVAPEGFEVIGSTATTPIQMIVDDANRMAGTQFHPEYFTDEHPAGEVMIQNFMRWVL